MTETEPIVFRNAFLIDGNGSDPVPDSVVTVSGRTIKEVVPSGKGGRIPGGRVIDLKGRTLMPGLIDAHVHAGVIEIRSDLNAAIPQAVYVHQVSRILETDIDLGFTTLRDAAWLDSGFRDAVDQGFIRGPRLLLSVSCLTQTGGHGDKRPFTVKNPVPRNSLGIYPEICDGPDGVRRAAREVLRCRADHIKVMADGGVVSPSDRPGHYQFTVEELRAAVEVADAAETYVMAHTYFPKAIRNCLEAGVRSIEHGNLLDDETCRMMAERGTFYVPTLTTYSVLSEKGAEAGMDPLMLEKLGLVNQTCQRALECAYRAGVRIGSGSDIIGPFQHLKGRELVLKAEVMSPMEAIVSATRTNAEILRLSDKLGTIDPGKLADLIVIDGNPLEDIGLFERGPEKVALVMKEGEIMKDCIRW